MRFMMPLLIGLSLCHITAIAAVGEGSSPEPVGETSWSRFLAVGAPSRSRCQRCPGRRDLLVSML